MATIDHERKRISAILLFYGPPGSGKTTALYALSRILPPGTHGKVAPLVQGDGRLLRLDYRPHDQELVYGYQVNFRLVTCAGPIDVDLLRPLISAVDAIMFVADSSPGALQANAKAFELLDRMVRGVQRRMDDLPLVFMYNKRDLRDAVEIRVLESRLNRSGSNYIAASAVRGQGVLEALQRLSATVAVELRRQMQAHGGDSAAAASNAKTVAHGTTFEAAQRIHGNDDVTSVASSTRPAPARPAPAQEWDISLGDDDRTEINPQSDWVDASPDETAFSTDRRRGAPQPSAAAFRRDRSDLPEPLPEPHSAFRAEPIQSTSSWRTPDAFHDGVDADDRTMPGSEVAELMREHDLIAQAPVQQRVAAGGGGRSRPEASARRAPVSHSRLRPAAGRAPRVETGRGSGRYSASATSSGRSTAQAGRARRIDPRGGDSFRTPSPRPPPVVEAPPPPPPPPDPEPSYSANQTQVINALGRSPESWEAMVLETGHPMRVPVPDLAGYVVSRIGTPTASSRRTVRLPVRATHMDTLVPQDFVLEIDFRGGGGAGSGPAVSARRRPVERERRTVPLSWIVSSLGVFAIVIVMVIVIVNALGG
jgi:signal recognition particle receptor subunit beta